MIFNFIEHFVKVYKGSWYITYLYSCSSHQNRPAESIPGCATHRGRIARLAKGGSSTDHEGNHQGLYWRQRSDTTRQFKTAGRGSTAWGGIYEGRQTRGEREKVGYRLRAEG